VEATLAQMSDPNWWTVYRMLVAAMLLLGFAFTVKALFSDNP
jgi:hypothetical protein